MQRKDVYTLISSERQRQDGLYSWAGYNDLRRLAVLTEELGEVAHDILREEDFSGELIHLAAAAVRWLELLPHPKEDEKMAKCKVTIGELEKILSEEGDGTEIKLIPRENTILAEVYQLRAENATLRGELRDNDTTIDLRCDTTRRLWEKNTALRARVEALQRAGDFLFLHSTHRPGFRPEYAEAYEIWRALMEEKPNGEE